MSATGKSEQLKVRVRHYWENSPCGSTRAEAPEGTREFFEQVERTRYELEPFIPSFADFEGARGQRVLEIGIGVGSDFARFARAGAIVTGVDLTEHAVELVGRRLELEGLRGEVLVADAENLPFADASFDRVYSWGVLHHTPDTPRAVAEAIRVLRPGGRLCVMLYGKNSWVSYGLWAKHALLRGRPQRTLADVLGHHMESEGTKAFSRRELRQMLDGLTDLRIEHVQTPYDRRFAGPLARLTGNRLGWFVVARGTRRDDKQAAVEQWTADPCESGAVKGEPGSAAYIEALLRARADHAPWLAEALAYDETAGLHVLDVGCGQGIDLVQYARAGAQVTGVDLTPRHVQLARAHLAALRLDGEVVVGDAETLPFEDETFVRVSSNGVLHHTPDMPAALREILRVLEPGGQACVIVYNRDSFHYWLQQVLYEGIVRRRLFEERSMEGVLSRGVEHSSIGARPLVRVYSPRKLRRVMRDAGFTEVQTAVRHLRPEDSFVTSMLRPYLRPRALDVLGRVGGWYVVGRGTRPG